MNRGRLSIILAAVVIVGAFALKNFLAEQKVDKRVAPKGTVTTVETNTVELDTHYVTAPVSGKLMARNRIEIFAEVSGRLQNQAKRFDIGNSFAAGETLISIDDTEFKATVIAQKSEFINNLTTLLSDIKIDFPNEYEKWRSYLTSIEIESSLPKLPAPNSEKEKFFITGRGLYTAYYNIKSAEERLQKYNITAPFTGSVTAAMIKPGTLVRIGQKLGDFIQPGDYEMEVAIPSNWMERVRVGSGVNLTSPDIPGNWTGTIQRIGKKVDENTQSITAYVEVRSMDLIEGMFLEGAIQVDPVYNGTMINRNMINSDQSVFVVRDGKLAKVSVEVHDFNGDRALISGIEAGENMPKQPIPEAFEGMEVNLKD
jgi:multidrug efflux pump subunit AcrA (membrane-fusion protein)